ncbi:alpha-mannosidase [Saccharibacillus kuerlensis]|uniref:Glycoside hydrolase family 38 central domain-containing protein n=1 Tax=Saccharibacillus kuerlensis TaxID=459527 RepID=A0ABQ2L344_9BACL|nr:alpha-mannosidase [Saccharibacillus kuerlensis]GGO00613.1 hypothetical protein GCM10010969_22020 [Saccharibacillus kuerlensis]
MNRQTAYLISHTHWDREWYLPYERHHMRLIELMDTLLDTLEQNPDYRSFHLDGQTIIIEDYLQVRPDNRERLEKLIRDGRIAIGPWYVLQDEFLTSAEANVRNLLIGHQDAARYGSISKLGYFPDSFGNMGQAPQMLVQADIDTAVFGRGVKPTGFANAVYESDTYESPYSEMHWRSPDGSSVNGVLFANWYSNGMEVPIDINAAREYWTAKLADASKYASTPHLLFMNGCDHQPVQTDLPEALETARSLFPDTDFKHVSFDEYLEALRPALPDNLVTVDGELRSQRTDGWGTLVNTASARMYLKQMNQQGQTLLERGAEPLALLAHLAGGRKYPHHELTYAWKTLMQNHPHDSICGCSVDEVHREMVTRFEKSRHTAEAIVDASLQALTRRIDTANAPGWDANAVPFAVFNTTGWTRSGVVTVELDIARLGFGERPSIAEITAELQQIELESGRCGGPGSGESGGAGSGRVLDSRGREVYAELEDLGVHFGYELPDDRFRQPYMARRVRLTLEAREIAPLGYAAYAWLPASGAGLSVQEGRIGSPEAAVGGERASDGSGADGSPTGTAPDAFIEAVQPQSGRAKQEGELAAAAPGSAADSISSAASRSAAGTVGFNVSAESADHAQSLPHVSADNVSSLRVHERGMANDYVAVEFRTDGSYDLTDKITGRTYSGLGVYEDCGDVGNEYVFRQPEGETALTTAGLEASISVVESSPVRVVFEIIHDWQIPAGMEKKFEEEKRFLVPFTERKSQRVSSLVPLRIVTRMTLERESKGPTITASFDNQAFDHRLRVLFPSGLKADRHLADSIFEAAERDTKPAPEWINPSNAQHQHAFVGVSDGSFGLTAANKGLNEYEVLQDDAGTLAVTLLRSSSELGDWGVFPTPEAQCLGPHTAEFALFPHAGNTIESGTYAEAYQYQTPWFVTQTSMQKGPLPASGQLLEWSGDSLAFSAAKLSEEYGDVVLRWYNLSQAPSDFVLRLNFPHAAMYESDILERRREMLPNADGEDGERTTKEQEGATSLFSSDSAEQNLFPDAEAKPSRKGVLRTEVGPTKIVTYAVSLSFNERK